MPACRRWRRRGLSQKGGGAVLIWRQALDKPLHAAPGGPHPQVGQPCRYPAVTTPFRVKPERIAPNSFRYTSLTPLFHCLILWGGYIPSTCGSEGRFGRHKKPPFGVPGPGSNVYTTTFTLDCNSAASSCLSVLASRIDTWGASISSSWWLGYNPCPAAPGSPRCRWSHCACRSLPVSMRDNHYP